MGVEIIRLWWWDPPSDMIDRSCRIRLRNLTENRQDDIRQAKPDPIHHPSRTDTTFRTKQPVITYGTRTMQCPSHNLNQDEGTVELPSGQILLGTTPSLSWDRDGILLTPREGLAKMEDVQCTDKSLVSWAATPTSEAWDFRTLEGFQADDDDLDDIEDAEESPSGCLTSFDIMSWYDKVVDSGLEPLPLTPSPFERGVMGGLSVNDVLMIKGLIDPRAYIQFFYPCPFSCP
jgi:hypothetical protein